jgi:hypothetical protein
MSLDFQYRDYTRADGGRVQAADYIGSTKWQHALTKSGVDRETANNLFRFIDDHDYTAAAREAGFYTPGVANNPYAGISSPETFAPRQAGFFTGNKGRRIDPFAGFRVNAEDSILNNQAKYRNVSIDGDYVNYQRKESTPLTSKGINPFSGSPFKKNLSGSAFSGSTQPRSRDEWINERSKLLNNTLITDQAYNKLTDTQKQFYGLTPDQAGQRDSIFGGALQGLDAAAQYRRLRSAKGEGTGLSGLANFAVGAALPLAAGAFAGPGAAAFASGFNSLKDGGSLADIAKSAGLTYFGAKALNNYGEAGSIWDKTGGGVQPLGAAAPATSGGNVGIFDQVSNLFNQGVSSLKGGGIFDTINNVLDSPLGQLGTDALGLFLGNREANELGDRLTNAAEGARFNPYNASGPGGGVTFNNGQVNTYLSPEIQALVDQLGTSASGNIDAFNSYNPDQQASELFGILEAIQQPYRDQAVNSNISTLINQGKYNPQGNIESPGYRESRALYDSINNSQLQNLYNSYGVAQDTANQVLNRGVTSTNALRQLNYDPLAYAGLGGDLGQIQSAAYSKGIPSLTSAANVDYANDANSVSRIFDTLRNRLG